MSDPRGTPDLRQHSSGSFLSGLASIGLLLAVYVVLDEPLGTVTQLPEASYRAPVIAVEFVSQCFRPDRLEQLARGALAGDRRRAVVGLAIVLLFALPFYFPDWRRRGGRLLCCWSEFSDNSGLRWLFAVPTLLAAWLASTYDYNLYFDQAHYFDRSLVILLALLVLWRPVFVFPFLAVLLTTFHQFSYPYASNGAWTEVRPLVRLLTLLGAAVLLRALSGRNWTRELIFAAGCLIAAQYWGSGLGKLRLHWIGHPHLDLLVFGAYANGWLGDWPPESIVKFSQLLAPATVPMMLFTLLIEWGAILLFWRRGVAIALLLGFALFHLGVFAVSGMFFWKWIVVDVAFAVFLTRCWQQDDLLFSKPYFLLGVAVILASPWVFLPRNLSWYDTPVTYYRQLQAIGESGQPYKLSPRMFSPYDVQTTLGPFSCYSQHPQLTSIWGITSDREVAEALVNAKTAEEVFALERSAGVVLFDEQAAATFDEFFVRFLSNFNQRRSNATVFGVLQPPPHLWTTAAADDATIGEPIVKLVIWEVTYFYDGQKLEVIRERVLRELPIPSGATAGGPTEGVGGALTGGE